MKFQGFSDNLCLRREVSCFVDGCQLVTKHVIVMISFIRKPRRREGRSEVDDIISPSMSTPNLKQAHGSTSFGAPCNSLRSNAKCVVYSEWVPSSCISHTRVFQNDVLIDPGLGIRTRTRGATPRVHPWWLLSREGQVQSRVGQLSTFKSVIKPVIK